MAGMQSLEVEISQVFSCLFYPFSFRREKVQTTNNINNLAFLTDFPGVFCNIAYPRVGTTGDDNKPFIGAEGKGRVIQQEIWFRDSIRMNDLSQSWIRLLERELTGDLSQKDEILCYPQGFIR